ncbi:hypothetical protein PTI98_007086 [Pleurotus ostreatus]|nr:hypothetical protein PTI98_007086 [Pleurotus ostreatus]
MLNPSRISTVPSHTPTDRSRTSNSTPQTPRPGGSTEVRQVTAAKVRMLFVINPAPEGEARSFKAFRDLAIATNGMESASSAVAPSSSAPSSVDTYVTPPAPKWETATATITHGQSVWTMTYTSYDGTPLPTPAPQPAEHKITAGANGEFVFTPAISRLPSATKLSLNSARRTIPLPSRAPATRISARKPRCRTSIAAA